MYHLLLSHFKMIMMECEYDINFTVEFHGRTNMFNLAEIINFLMLEILQMLVRNTYTYISLL